MLDWKMYWEKRYILIFLTVLFHVLKEFQYFQLHRYSWIEPFYRGEKSESVKYIRLNY